MIADVMSEHPRNRFVSTRGYSVARHGSGHEDAPAPPHADVPRVLVVYNSIYGNTRSIAKAIGSGIGVSARVEVVAAHGRLELDREKLDLLVVGGPTHRRGLSERLQLFLSEIGRESLPGLRAATFDTRYRGKVLATGSAARKVRKHLRKAGCSIETRPKSFFVERDRAAKGKHRHEGERLEAGELERARAWGTELLALLPSADRADS